MFQNDNITQSGDFQLGPKAAFMIATSHNMVHDALRTIIIHKIIIKKQMVTYILTPFQHRGLVNMATVL